MIDFQATAKKIKESDLLALEKSLGFKFPDDIRSHYLKTNGGRVEGDLIFGDEYCITDILPIKHPSEYSPSTLESVYDLLAVSDKRIPKWLVPFGNEATGGVFCFSLRKKDYGAIFYHSGDNETPGKLAKSFTAFSAGLVLHEEIDSGTITDGSSYAKRFRCNGSRHFVNSDLEALQVELGADIPIDVLNHYQEVNGGYVDDPCEFSHGGYRYSVQEFYPLSSADPGSTTIGDLRKRLKLYGAASPWLIVFGTVIPKSSDDETGLGELAFSIRNDENGAIYLISLDHGDDTQPVKVAKNLQEFVSSLAEMSE